jgi:tryptophanyl-tRNA synthetase
MMAGIIPISGSNSSSAVPSSHNGALGTEVKLNKTPNLLRRIMNFFSGKQLEKATDAMLKPAPHQVPTQKSSFFFLSGLFNIRHKETKEERDITNFSKADTQYPKHSVIELPPLKYGEENPISKKKMPDTTKKGKLSKATPKKIFTHQDPPSVWNRLLKKTDAEKKQIKEFIEADENYPQHDVTVLAPFKYPEEDTPK